MREVSNDYKIAMDFMKRDRAYISIGLGVVNNEAQKSAQVTSACADWCRPNSIFSNANNSKNYATMEENFFKTDGSMSFFPEVQQPVVNEVITKDLIGSVVIVFNGTYSIKGLTIDFGDTYPTEFEIISGMNLWPYLNDSNHFETTDVFEAVSYIIIDPRKMVGGQQRMRIKRITFGIGLSFGNSELKDFSYNDYVSSISEELPGEEVNINILDKNNQFNVDDKNSYIQFLETGQEVNVSFGITLKDKSVEWLKHTTLYLNKWDSVNGYMNISAVDKLSFLNEEYSGSYKIFKRTAYDEAVSIFSDAGLNDEDYIIDDYLKTIILDNPMPIATHKECLQILANACRCKIRHNSLGKIVIQPNFVNSIDSSEIVISSNSELLWSSADNLFAGADSVYADITKDFFKLDGSMFFIPEKNEDLLNSGYVSNQISDSNGYFNSNPKISIEFPAAYSYRSISFDFVGHSPKLINVFTYHGDDEVQNEQFYNNDIINNKIVFPYEFKPFNRIVVEFVQTQPFSRIVVNKMSFGDLTDYCLKKSHMKTMPHGYAEEKVKSVNVRVYQFEISEEGEPYETGLQTIVKNTIGLSGKNILLENQLISTISHAEQVASWLANHYSNNITYDVDYRGEPRIEAGDIIQMDSDFINDLHVSVENHTLNFNGGFSGNLIMRRALKTIKARGD